MEAGEKKNPVKLKQQERGNMALIYEPYVQQKKRK